MRYDAFISYSHAADGLLAPAVQGGLQRFAKPWWRLRALHVFRDETGLAVNPDLWHSIEGALHDSKWFILLCSPDAASSTWVNKEIRAWLDRMPSDSILLVHTDGSMSWDAAAGDFSADSDAIPEALRGQFLVEPLYLDMRWARSEIDLSPRNSAYRAAIARLAARIRGVAPEDLEGEDIRQHRRARRLAWSAALTLVAVTSLAVIGAAAAVANARSARSERRTVVQTNQALRLRQAALAKSNHNLALSKRALVATNDNLRQSQDSLRATNSSLKASQRSLGETNAKLRSSQTTLEATNANLRTSQHALTQTDVALQASDAALRGKNVLLAQKETALKKKRAQLTAALHQVSIALAESERQRTTANNRALAAEGLLEAQTGADLDTGLLLASEASRHSPDAIVRDEFLRALQQQPVDLLGYLPPLRHAPTDVSASDDGRLIALSDGSTPLIVRSDLRQAIALPELDNVTLARFSASGERIAVVNAQNVRVVDLPSARIVRFEAAPNDGAVALDHAGANVAYGSRGRITILNVGSGHLRTIALPASLVIPAAVAFSSDGTRLAVVGVATSVAFTASIAQFDTRTGLEAAPIVDATTFPSIQPRPLAEAFSLRFDGSYNVTMTARGKSDPLSATFDANDAQTASVPTDVSDLRPIGHVDDVTVDGSRFLQLRAPRDSSPPLSVQVVATDSNASQPLEANFPASYGAGEASVQRFVGPSGAEVVIVGPDGRGRLVAVQQAQPIPSLATVLRTNERVYAISSDGSVAATASDTTGHAYLVNARSGRYEGQLEVGQGNVVDMKFNRDGDRLLAIVQRTDPLVRDLVEIDVATRRQLRHVPTTATSVAMSPDGKLMALDEDIERHSVVYIRRVSTLSRVSVIGRPDTDSYFQMFLPGSTTAIVEDFPQVPPAKCCIQGVYRTASALTGETITHSRLEGCSGAAVSEIARIFACANGQDQTIEVHDLNSGKILYTLPGVGQISLSPNGLMMALNQPFIFANNLSNIQLFDLTTRRQLGTRIPLRALTGLEFSSNGEELLGRDTQGIERIPVTLSSWRALVCRVVGRDLTESEWHRFGGIDPVPTVCDAPKPVGFFAAS